MKLLRTPLRRPRRAKATPAKSPPAHPPGAKWPWMLATLVGLMAFYFWTSSAGIIAEPVELHFGPDSPVFGESLGPLLGAEFTPGNRIELLTNGDSFFPAMLAD